MSIWGIITWSTTDSYFFKERSTIRKNRLKLEQSEAISSSFYFLTRLNWCMLLLRRSWFFNQKIFSSRFSDIFILRTGALQRKLKLRLPFWNKCTEKKREGIFSFSTVSIWKFSVPYRSPWSFLFTLEIKNMTFTTRLVEHNFKLYYGSLKS